jgi:hypothetical protein
MERNSLQKLSLSNPTIDWSSFAIPLVTNRFSDFVRCNRPANRHGRNRAKESPEPDTFTIGFSSYSHNFQ